ncbi:YihY/virulence factor BrkB family protein [Streptomyces sp. NBC_01341]|uniref:ribonuclease BN n=1 Tax=Streptomyces sp. NBC_01341 TaxID=2903831 RepID=UPI002E0E19EE|nr:YihY/virulence factor BrkB family protein [Streptomyces sp. NBC_01341]
MISHSAPGRGWRRGRELELGQRALSFAALGFLTLIPLLIIVSAADRRGQGFAQWLGQALGVSAASQKHVEKLFALPGQALQTTTAFGLAALAAFGLSFGSAVQTGYEKVWDLVPARWWATWRHLAWLGVFAGYVFVSATTRLLHTPLGGVLASVSAVLFFWWSQRLLLGGRVRWVALLPGSVLTVIGLLGLRVFSRIVFSPLIASSTASYGPVGTVLILQSWLVGVGVVVFGGALVGRILHEEFPRVSNALGRRR